LLCLQILVQLSGSPVCINEMLSNKLIPILSSEVMLSDSIDIWMDVAHLLLAVVVYRTDLSRDDVVGTLNIVKRMCVAQQIHGSQQQQAQQQAQASAPVPTSPVSSPGSPARKGPGGAVSAGAEAKAVLAASQSSASNSSSSSSTSSSATGSANPNGVSDELVIQCTTVLSFLSLQLTDDAWYAELDVILRSILTSTSTVNLEQLFDPCATVIYNITCSESSMVLLLKDGLYLNIMIKMMRAAKPHIQEVVSEAIRTLCSSRRCIELLLNMDLLSDLIVIALLRTSSDTIKEVCCQGFFNMLCCSEFRMRLLKGDLWWAVMRLSRSGNKAISWTCQRILYDLSTTVSTSAEDEVIVPLRDNHVLTFLRDISSAKSVPGTSAGRSATAKNKSSFRSDDVDIAFVEQCLGCMNNFVFRYVAMHAANKSSPAGAGGAPGSGSPTKSASKAPAGSALATVQASAPVVTNFAAHEVNAIVTICTDIVQLSKDIKSVQIALMLLLKLAQDTLRDVVTETIAVDIDQIILNAHSLWGTDVKCCLLVTRIFWELTKSPDFTKAVDVVNIVDAMCVAYNACSDASGDGAAAAVSMAEIISNVAGVTLNFVCSNLNAASVGGSMGAGAGSSSGATSATSSSAAATASGLDANVKVAKTFLTSQLWGRLVCDCFGVSKLHAAKMVIEERGVGLVGVEAHRRTILTLPNAADAKHGVVVGGSGGPVAVSSHAKALVFSVFVHMIGEALDHPANIPCPVVRSLLTLEHAATDAMKYNIKYIISKFSHVPELSAHLLDIGVFSLLNYFLKGVTNPAGAGASGSGASSGTANSAAEAASSEADISMFASSVLANLSLHTNLLPKLVASSDTTVISVINELIDNIGIVDSCKNVSFFFYNVCTNTELFKHSPINPSFVINTLFRMNKQFPEEVELVKLNKYIIGMVLNTYDLGPDVSPVFVQTIFNEMNHGSSSSSANNAGISAGSVTGPPRFGSGSTVSVHDGSVPAIVRTMEFIDIAVASSPKHPQSLLRSKKSDPMPLFMLPDSSTKWNRIIVRQQKIMERVVGHLANVAPAVVKVLESSEAFPGAVFEKTLLKFDKIPLDAQVTDIFPTDEEYMQHVLNEFNALHNSSVSMSDVNSVSVVEALRGSNNASPTTLGGTAGGGDSSSNLGGTSFLPQI
jgi:hypothetical protein